MDHYTEDDSMEDNLEPFLPHNGTNPRAAGSHCISSGKGLWPILYDYLFSQTLRYLDTIHGCPIRIHDTRMPQYVNFLKIRIHGHIFVYVFKIQKMVELL
jgi:hypothetical protein